jgi:hypothetical protein
MDIVITGENVRLGRYTSRGSDVDSGDVVIRERDSDKGVLLLFLESRLRRLLNQGSYTLLRRFSDED